MRQVTVLFADLVGFVELSSALDPEATHAILDRVFESIDGLVERHGGAVDKHIGDAVMAVFGAPTAHGDDPLRAVRTALEIHRAVAALGAEMELALSVHIGVAAGEVIAAGLGRDNRQEYTVLGDSVNLAARLNAMASPGETLISDAVQRSIADHVDCERVGETQIKGLAKPVRVWRVRALRDPLAKRWQTPFVGRLANLRQFSGILETCRDTGCGHAVLLRGEAGIGKTRLVEEFAALAESQGFGIHRGLILDFGVGKGQDAVRALIRSLLGVDPAGSADALRATADQIADRHGLERDQSVFLNDLLDLPQPAEMRAIYDAMDNAAWAGGRRAMIERLVRQVAGRRPVLLIVEDLHWADLPTLADLAAIATAAKDCQVILVMTSRTEGDPLDQGWRNAVRGTPLLTIDLGPLRHEEAVALARAFIEATNQWALTCIDRAAGNPLFLEQLLRHAEESGDEQVPASIQSLVLARIDRLPARDKRALQTASVIGQRFSLAVLRHLMEDQDYDCAEPLQHSLLAPDGADYLFAHALIQEGIYASLLKARRRALHGRAAAWFADRDPILYAQHLDRAGDPAASRAYLDAARLQARDHRYERALQLVDDGLALAQSQRDRLDLLCQRGELLHDLGRVADSNVCYRQALDIASSDIDRCRAWIGLAAGLRMSDGYDEALDVLGQAEAAALGDDAAIELSRIHHLRGNLYFPLGRLVECREEHERALACARRAGSPEDEVRALGGLGDAEYARGRMITAHDSFSRCVALCREYGFGRIEVANLPMVAVTRCYLNDIAGLLHEGQAAIEAAARVGHRRAEMIAHHAACMGSLESGAFARAEAHIMRASEIARHLGTRRFEAENLSFLSILRRLQGRRSESLALAQDAVAICRSGDMRYFGPAALAWLACATDDPIAREAALEEGEAILAAGSVSHNHLWFHRDAAELALGLSDWSRAEHHADALEAYTRAEPLPWSDFFIARARALAAHGRGARDDRTIEMLRQLRDQARRAGLSLALPALDAVLAAA